MEIRILRVSNQLGKEGINVEFLDSLSEVQLKNAQSHISVIEELHNIRRLKEFVILNDKEIIDYINLTLEKFIHKSEISWNNVTREDGDLAFLHANRLILNYLSSIRTFIDHSETFFKKKYGNKSKEALLYKEILSQFFDNSFAYRFFINYEITPNM